MFLHRLAAGLVFLAGVGLSRLGVVQESWPILALGLLAATVGLWHFLMGGSASQVVRGETRRTDALQSSSASAEPGDLRTH
jgi:hypothetical protein